MACAAYSAYPAPFATSLEAPTGARGKWAARRRRVPTVLAPALPALILLAVTTAGTVDPPRSGLESQLHLTAVTTTVTPR